jgi:hypothetical protein
LIGLGSTGYRAQVETSSSSSAYVPFHRETHAYDFGAEHHLQFAHLRHAEFSPSPRGIVMRPPQESEAVFQSTPIFSRHPFREALLSWNVEAPPSTGFTVELRVGDRSDESWSPWMCAGEWGVPVAEKGRERFLRGGMDGDVFRSGQTSDRIQFRVRAVAASGAQARSLRIERVMVVLSDPQRAAHVSKRARPPLERWQRDLPVASRDPADEAVPPSRTLGSCISAVLAYRGVDRSAAEVAARVHDAERDRDDSGSRAVQAAFDLGVRGYVERFSEWIDVEESIAAGQPLILAIEDGGAARDRDVTARRRFVVLTGFDEQGAVLVQDPAEGSARRKWTRGELERIWMAHGGWACVLLPR